MSDTEFHFKQLSMAMDRLTKRLIEMERRFDALEDALGMLVRPNQFIGDALLEGMTPEKAEIIRQMLPSIYERKDRKG